MVVIRVGGIACRGRNAPLHRRESSREALNGSPKALNSNGLVLSPPNAPLDADGLLMYFANAVLPRFQLVKSTLPLDLTAINKDQPLRQAVLAVAQAHHDTFSHATSNHSLVSRRRSRHSAIHLLRERLENDVDVSTTAQQLFPVNVLLCMLDGMVEPSEQENASVYHLKGGYALIQGNANIPTVMLRSGGLQAHLLSLFATIDLVHALLSGERPWFDPHIWYMFSDTQVWFGRLHHDDKFLALLKTFSELAILGHTVFSQLPSKDGQQLAVKCIPSIDAGLALGSPSEASATPDPAITTEHWRRFCALYEITAKIYILRALRMLPGDHEHVQLATRTGIKYLSVEGLPGMLAHCVIFPILVIGVHATDADDRRTIVQAISSSRDYLSFGNLQNMTDLLQSVWSNPKPDMKESWWDCFRPLYGKVFLF